MDICVSKALQCSKGYIFVEAECLKHEMVMKYKNATGYKCHLWVFRIVEHIE